MITNYNKKQVTLAITIGILLILSMFLSFSYGYWQITKTQKTPNNIVAACLDLELINEKGSFNLEKTWPMSDEEGSKLSGYTFSVKNNCETPINYIVGLNSLEIENAQYLDYSNLKLKIDGKTPTVYSKFSNHEYLDVQDSKLISRETIAGNSTNTHNVKLWIDEDAPVTEQSKKFKGQVFITGGQGVPLQEDCFAVTSDGTILAYDSSCGMDVVVPATVENKEIKNISGYSFAGGDAVDLYLFDENGDEFYYLLYKDNTNQEELENYIKEMNGVDDLESIYTKVFYNFQELKLYSFPEYEYLDAISILKDDETDEFIAEYGISLNIKTLDLEEAIYLENIEDYAFNNTTLKKVVFPQNGNLTKINYMSFYNNKIEELVISDNITTISHSAFAGNKLKKVTIPNSVTTIGNEAFEANEIEEIYIPDSVQSIGSFAFANNNLSEVIIPDSVQSIGSYAFAGNNLKSLTLPKDITVIEKGTFSNNDLVNITIPDKVKTIGDSAFLSNQLKEVTIPSSVETIGFSAFRGSSTDGGTLTKVIFEDTEENPSKLKTIESWAFAYNKLTKLEFPRSLDIIEERAFKYNTLEEVIMPDYSVETIEEEAFQKNKINKLILPIGLKNIEQNVFGGSEIKTLHIPYGVSVIGNGAFINNEISTLTFSESNNTTATIGERAFYGNNIENLTIPTWVNTIKTYAFANNQIKTLNIIDEYNRASKLTLIEDHAFENNQIEIFAIPRSLTTIEWSAFEENELTKVYPKWTSNNKLQTIENSAFSNNKINSLTLPESVTTIGSGAFSQNALSKVVIPSTVENIDMFAFNGNPNLATIIVKRSSSEGMTLSSSWNLVQGGSIAASNAKFAEVIYNPYYTE